MCVFTVIEKRGFGGRLECILSFSGFQSSWFWRPMGIGHVGIGLDRILPARSKLLLPLSRVRVGFSSFLFFYFYFTGRVFVTVQRDFFFFFNFWIF